MTENTHVGGLVWRKSSFSGEDPNKTECVEIAFADGGAFVRDSKDPDGPRLKLGEGGWGGLLAAFQQGNVEID